MPLLRNLLRAPSIVVLTLLAGCEPEAPPQVPPPPAPPPTAEPAPPPPAPKRTSFQDPGGMWMPEQIPAQAAQLKELGLEVDPAALSDPASGVLGAVVSLGGCSASFVSDDGLIATNHHCSIGALQYNSTPAQNLLTDGFLAKTRAEEKWAGPTARVYVTVSLRDVTKDVTDGIAAIKKDADRQKKVEERTKGLVAACEKGRPDRRCNVASFFGGGQYRLVEQLEIKDVRLVFAPHDRIGDYGGEVDNWHWPRHAGDVSFLRAYVGPDGKPADHADANVPYHPPHRLKLPSKPLMEGDLVFVAGYPGTTNRLRTAAEADEAVSFTYPHQIQWCDENIALLDKFLAQGGELRIKANNLWRGLSNYRTKMKGIVDGLVKGGLAAQKAKREADLAAWIATDPSRTAAYGDVLGKIKALGDERAKTREHDALMVEMQRLVRLFGSASTIVRMAEERPRPDADRDPMYQERNWERIEQGQAAMQKSFDRRIDEALLKLAVQRALKVPEKGRPELVAAILGKGKTTDEAIDKAIEALYDKTALGDENERVKLVKTAKLADLKKSKDPLIKLALKLRPTYKAIEDKAKAYEGAMLILRPRYVEALQKLDPKPLAPDANGTLRVTYGTVRGYRPTADAQEYVPFTTVSAMAAKATGVDPFDAPSYLLDAVKVKKFGPYAQTPFGEPTVDFLSDLDITGGNSGSPTLNSRGEIVGLAFDGNYEAMASDWLFMPSITRTIHVDFRYVLWLLDAVYPGQHLIREMGGTPAFQ